MFLNRLWADWQRFLHFYLTGSVLVFIESRWYSAENHCEQGPGTPLFVLILNFEWLSLIKGQFLVKKAHSQEMY